MATRVVGTAALVLVVLASMAPAPWAQGDEVPTRLHVSHDEGEVCIGTSELTCMTRQADGTLDFGATKVTVNGKPIAASGAGALNGAAGANSRFDAGTPKSCDDVHMAAAAHGIDAPPSGAYELFPAGDVEGAASYVVACEFNGERRGPWATVMRRVAVDAPDDLRVSFAQGADDYAAGFGDASRGDFFVGLEALADMTEVQGSLGARVELFTSSGPTMVQEVNSFAITRTDGGGYAVEVSDPVTPEAATSLLGLDGFVFAASDDPSANGGEFDLHDGCTVSGNGWFYPTSGCDMPDLMLHGNVPADAAFVDGDSAPYPVETATLSVRPSNRTGDRPRSCLEILNEAPSAATGVYTIYPDAASPGAGIKVRCDMDTTKGGGGWTVFQRRFDGSVAFNNNWAQYEAGFGSPEGEHWLGLRALHTLSSNLGNMALRVEESLDTGVGRVQSYEAFAVGDSASKYELSVAHVLTDPATASVADVHHGQKFTTIDQDNDESGDNCAAAHGGGGWWYQSCWSFAPNNVWGDGPTSEQWLHISDTAFPPGSSGYYAIGRVALMIREHSLTIHGHTCKSILDEDPTADSGMYRIDPSGTGSTFIDVWCDMGQGGGIGDGDIGGIGGTGGGWIVFQQRRDGSVPFHTQNWAAYSAGFGNLLTGGEGWMGLDRLSTITALLGNVHYRQYQACDTCLSDGSGGYKVGLFHSFGVGDASTDYTLTVGDVQTVDGNNDIGLIAQSGMAFSTPDVDNDVHGSHCASMYPSGWWLKDCWRVNLNLVWAGDGATPGSWQGISDTTWPPGTNAGSGGTTFSYTQMAIREP